MGRRLEKGVNRPVDQFHRVQGDERPKYDLPQGQEYEAQEKKSREEEAAHAQHVRIADAYWKKKAQEKDWECVAPDLSVYKYSGV